MFNDAAKIWAVRSLYSFFLRKLETLIGMRYFKGSVKYDVNR